MTTFRTTIYFCRSFLEFELSASPVFHFSLSRKYICYEFHRFFSYCYNFFMSVFSKMCLKLSTISVLLEMAQNILKSLGIGIFYRI